MQNLKKSKEFCFQLLVLFGLDIFAVQSNFITGGIVFRLDAFIVIGSTQYYTTRLNRGGDAQRERKKLPCDSKNRCRAETVERCSINRTRLIEYNWVQSRVRVHKLMNNEDRCSGITLRVKRKGQLIVRLKAIKSREDTFCYLSSYLHCSFF